MVDWVHRVGTPAQGHTMSLSTFRAYADAILAVHKPTSDVPEPRIEFPDGFWITYSSAAPDALTPDEPAGRIWIERAAGTWHPGDEA